MAKYDPKPNRLCVEIGSSDYYQIADHGARNKRGLPLQGGESDCGMETKKQRANREKDQKGFVEKTLILAISLLVLSACATRDAKMAALQIQILYLEDALDDCRKGSDESEALLNGCEKILDDLEISR